MKLWRLQRLHYGGVWEWMLGARYFNMRDQFDLLGTNFQGTPPINPNQPGAGRLQWRNSRRIPAQCRNQ